MKPVRLLITAFALLAILAPQVWAASSVGRDEQISGANWRAHPRIVEIRQIYREVRERLDAGSWKPVRRDFEYCEPYRDMTRRIHTDGNGVARHYHAEGGSDDSAVRRDFYYDGAGRLRFAFIAGGAVNGTSIEHRIYFDEAGARIWEIQRLVEGPGYTFPSDRWPEDDLVRDPKQAYAAAGACPEAAPADR